MEAARPGWTGRDCPHEIVDGQFSGCDADGIKEGEPKLYARQAVGHFGEGSFRPGRQLLVEGVRRVVRSNNIDIAAG